MGNTTASKQNTSISTPSQSQLQLINQTQQGFVAQSLTSGTKYFIRQLSFSSQEQLRKILPSIQRIQQNNHPTTISLLHTQQINIKNMCGSIHKLRLIFQYSMLSINDQIEARTQDMRYFQYADACRIVHGCVSALAQLQKSYDQNQQLAKLGIINHVYINPQRILIMQDSIIKIINNLIVSPYDRFQYRHNSYYSPQKLYDFDFQQDEKSIIFQLGITLLHILTLKSCKQVYNGFQVKQDQIDVRIYKIWELYHDTFLCEILSKITRTFRNFRIGIRQCEEMVQFLYTRLQERQQKESIQRQKMNRQKYNITNNNQHNMPLNNTKYYTQLDQVCQRIQSQASQQINQQSYYYNYTNNKQTEKQKQKYRQLQMQNKQNYMFYSNSNKKISSLKYSAFSENSPQKSANKLMSRQNSKYKIQSHYRTNSKNNLGNNLNDYDKENNINNINRNRSSKKSIQLPSFIPQQQNHSKLLNMSAQKQSCVITPQSPFYNIAMIASHSFLSPNHQEAKGKLCKQSYFYGNQLAQGIIQARTNIQPIHKTQDVQDIQQKKQTKKNINKFEWKRTQFNKKQNRNGMKRQQTRLPIMENINQMQNNIYLHEYQHSNEYYADQVIQKIASRQMNIQQQQ